LAPLYVLPICTYNDFHSVVKVASCLETKITVVSFESEPSLYFELFLIVC
jgi:hypothetical protein